MAWIMAVDSEYYDAFVNGQKIVEGRKNNPGRWGRVRKGDTILLKRFGVLSHGDDSRFFTVMATRTYPGIEEYLRAETLEKTLPGVASIEEGVKVYLGFWGPEGLEEVARVGVIAIELRPGRF